MHHNSSFYDAYWSVLPPLLCSHWWIESARPASTTCGAWLVHGRHPGLGGPADRQLDPRRSPGLHHEDWRYPMLREQAGRAEARRRPDGHPRLPDAAGVPRHAAGLRRVTRAGRDARLARRRRAWSSASAPSLLELVADVQMHRFARTEQPGQVMDQGLWAWSRHPNYFGEVSFWFSLGALRPGRRARRLVVGLRRRRRACSRCSCGASIPMMEQRSLERRPAYQDVIDRVPRFVPRPPRRGRADA